MKDIFENYLFEKHYFVANNSTPNPYSIEVQIALAKYFNIRILSNTEYLETQMISLAQRELGMHVPEAFYRGFPQSVLSLTPIELTFDQVLHYFRTYGIGDFSEAGHSVFEPAIERKLFNEKVDPKEFNVITVDEAKSVLRTIVDELLLSTRPISDHQFELITEFISEYRYFPEACASKNTAIRLLIRTRDPRFTKFISLPDVLKLAEELNHGEHPYNRNFKKLNLSNQSRKLLTKVLDTIFSDDRFATNIAVCYERKAQWAGLLHHIHYAPKNELARLFMEKMRGKGPNISAYADFERLIKSDPVCAASTLLHEKGSGALLRNLDYILSRCKTEDEAARVIRLIDSKNLIVLLQLMNHYRFYSAENGPRTFKFVRHNLLRVHLETRDEMIRRRTRLGEYSTTVVSNAIRELIFKNLSGRLGKVYIAPGMENIALPMQEGTSQGGFGTLTRGSRIPIEKGKKIRAFTYWEKVNDIDLSVIGINSDGSQSEFSWRTMRFNQTNAICYSGDQTSGYHGGSEYFDVDPVLVKKQFPDMKYLVFCNNVFSGKTFSECVCRAGYMLRDRMDSGEVFVPKTVKTSFTIDCESTFAYLFAIDLETNEFVWLNTIQQSTSRIAGNKRLGFLEPYFHAVEVMNLKEFFTAMAAEVTDSVEDADVILTDDMSITGSEKQEVIRSWDTEKVLRLLNQ